MTMQPGFADLALPDLRLRVGDDILPTAGAVDVEDPSTGAIVAQVPVAGADAVDAAVAAARAALVAPAWRDLAPLARERLLHRLADAMEADLPRLAALEALDTGKPLSQAETVDIPSAIAWLRGGHRSWPGGPAP